MPDLIIQTGVHRGKKITFPKGSGVDVLIGRDPECQIRLGAQDISRRHCRISPKADGLVVCDLGSQNGTFVNDVRIEEERKLLPGDLLRVGPLILQVPRQYPEGVHDAAHTAQAVNIEPPKQDQSIDDEIVSWLADDVPSAGPGDTTIISNRQPQISAELILPPGEAKKKRFKSIADEAADIIRRHFEIKGKQPPQPEQQSL